METTRWFGLVGLRWVTICRYVVKPTQPTTLNGLEISTRQCGGMQRQVWLTVLLDLRRGRQVTRAARAHTTASATEVFLLPVLVCGTPCHHIWQDMNYSHFKHALKGHRL